MFLAIGWWKEVVSIFLFLSFILNYFYYVSGVENYNLTLYTRQSDHHQEPSLDIHHHLGDSLLLW